MKTKQQLFRTLGMLGLALAACLPQQAAADAIEISSGFSFNRSNYSDNNYSWTRRWGATVGYHFSEHSGLEFSFTDVVDRTYISGYEDTTFHDRVYSINWFQALAGKNSAIQPYVKVGVGQLNRNGNGSYAFGGSPALEVDSLTGVIGGGFKFFVTRTMALRVEGTSYLTGGRISTWKDNFATSFGLSLYL